MDKAGVRDSFTPSEPVEALRNALLVPQLSNYHMPGSKAFLAVIEKGKQIDMYRRLHSGLACPHHSGMR